MKRRLVPLLACPLTGGPLALTEFEVADDEGEPDVDAGVLTSGESRVYPIIEGVPRLIDGAFHLYPDFRRNYEARLREHGLLTPAAIAPPSPDFERLILPTLRRFQEEWGNHDLSGLTWGVDPATRVEHFVRYVGIPAAEFPGKVVLDAGAGTGQAACAYTRLGCEVVAVDLSPSVVRGWRARHEFAGEGHRRLHVVQGNLMQPPFRPGAFDAVHSSGVLHHTPGTRRAFESVARLVAPGGSFGVWLYRPAPDWGIPLLPFVRPPFLSLSVARLRRFTPRMNARLLWALLWTYVAVSQAFYKMNQLVRGRPHAQTVRERTTSLFDTLAPPYVHRHTPEEVAGWFRELGFDEIRETSLPGDDCGSNVTGRRPPASGGPT